jgi:hypothetical protein
MSRIFPKNNLVPAISSVDLNYRLLGFLPLIFFLLQGLHYWRTNELGHMLWMCNIGNLLLAVSIFLNRQALMRVAVLWTIPGLIIWVIFVVLPWGVFFSSILAHVGGTLMAMFVLLRVGMDRQTWLYATGWYLIVQLLSRLFTPATLNVNLAHHMQSGWEHTFGHYWQFLLTLDVLTAVMLWALGILMWKLRPSLADEGATTQS